MRSVRDDFPLIVGGATANDSLVYLDSAATTQTPQAVIDACTKSLVTSHANIHRGIYRLAERATKRYEDARVKVARFLNAASSDEVVFTHGATEALNMIAYSWARTNIPPGGLVVLGMDNHHANIVPWQMLAQERKIELAFVELGPDAALDLGSYEQLLERKPQLVSLTGMSNVTGHILPFTAYSTRAHEAGALFAIDAAQLVTHHPLDVQAADIDFLAFSGHKMYGPTGVGVFYAKQEHLEDMTPFLGGGEMIEQVTTAGFQAAAAPRRFEAGTPAITQVVGLAAAIDYLEALGWETIQSHEQGLYDRTVKGLAEADCVHLLGYPNAPKTGDIPSRCGIVSFTVDGLHPHDCAQFLDSRGIAVRAGHHCAMPLHQALGVPASVRVSLALYTTNEDIDALIHGLREAHRRLGRRGVSRG